MVRSKSGEKNQLRLVAEIPLFTGFYTCQVVGRISSNSIVQGSLKNGRGTSKFDAILATTKYLGFFMMIY